MEEPINSKLFEEIISGTATREAKIAVCSGSASLSLVERSELLTTLAADSDDAVRERAESALLTLPVEGFVIALKSEKPSIQLICHCGRTFANNPEVAALLVKNRHCPPEVFPAVVKALTPAAIQDLMKDLDLLSTSPALSTAMLKGASLSPEQRQLIEELIRDDAAGESSLADAVASADLDQEKRKTLLERLAKMRVVERVQLALKGNREERIILIRDSCKVVQRAVLQSTRITDREVEGFAAMASLSDEVLRLIAANKAFLRNYTVVRNLVNNPKTPLDISLHLLPTIIAQDLKMLTTNRNVSDTLRTAAMRLQRQRAEKRPGS